MSDDTKKRTIVSKQSNGCITLKRGRESRATKTIGPLGKSREMHSIYTAVIGLIRFLHWQNRRFLTSVGIEIEGVLW